MNNVETFWSSVRYGIIEQYNIYIYIEIGMKIMTMIYNDNHHGGGDIPSGNLTACYGNHHF